MYGDNQSFNSNHTRSPFIEWSLDHDRYNDSWELLIWHRGSMTLQKKIKLEAHDKSSAIAESVKILARDFPGSYFNSEKF
jgi:hypothetical protein